MSSPRVMIVEDEVLIAETVRTKLLKLGYQIAGMAMSGEEALSIVGGAKPDVILMDIRLAGDLDGIQTAEKIREQIHVPVIFVTAYSDDETIARVKRCSPYGYIIKPFQLNDLRTNIELALYRFNVEQQQRMRQQQLMQAMRYVGDAVVVVEPDGLISFCNPNAEAVLSSSHDQLLGISYNQIIKLEYPVGVAPLDPLAHILSTGRQLELPPGVTLVNLGDRVVPIQGFFTPVGDTVTGISGMLFVFRETEPSQATMSSEIVSDLFLLQHKAQKELAHNLHEGLGQVLSAAKMNLESLNLQDQNSAPNLEISKNLLDEAVSRVRKLTQSVMPAMLNDFGLIPALEGYLKRTAKEAGVEIHFVPPHLADRLPAATEFHLFKLIQEFVSHALVHLRGKVLTVALHCETAGDLEVHLSVKAAAGLYAYTDEDLAHNELSDAIARVKLLGGAIALDGGLHLQFQALQSA